MYNKALFIHRRDLRVHDNTGLIAAVKASKHVIPCFIFDPRQIGEKNDYRSDFAQKFLCESLTDLQEQYQEKGGKLYVFEGEAEDVVGQLIQNEHIDAVYVNADYTPFSKKRDATIQKICKKHDVAFESHHDLLLIGDPSEALNGSGEPYKVFTPFYKYAFTTKEVPNPVKTPTDSFFTSSVKGSDIRHIKHYSPDISKPRVPGGRRECIKILKHIETFQSYKTIRDDLTDETTHLSAHNKFGTCSAREVFHAVAKKLGSTHELIRQLYWRDFFTQLADAFPHVFGNSFNPVFDKVKWTGSKRDFETWCNGRTGFPIVDAGMRELNQTGFMHNRARMIGASFLTKDLHIDWREGERYFASKLVDYDPCVNNGSWQWAAGTGADAAPYFRIFNPWLQQKKFDPEGIYIKRWIPEFDEGYIKPMIDHADEARVAKELYGVVAQK